MTEPFSDRRFVYFIEGETTRLIKIGWAVSVPKRMAEHQLGSPDRLRVLGIIENFDAAKLERALHQQFAHLREHGEWFMPGDDLAEFIATQTKPLDISDMPKFTRVLVPATPELRANLEYLRREMGMRSGNEVVRRLIDKAIAQINDSDESPTP